MGAVDIQRQSLNVFRMRLLGAMVHRVEQGSQTLKDAINEALRDWVTNVENTYYLLGSVVGPHPYPTIVRDFQSVIGREIREQSLQRNGRLPDLLVACVGGGSNAMGTFAPFLDEERVELLGAEAGGRGSSPGGHSASLTGGRVGVLHGARSYVLQDADRPVLATPSISASLDYSRVRPPPSAVEDTKRAAFVAGPDEHGHDGLQGLATF